MKTKEFTTIPPNCPICNGDREWYEVDKITVCYFCGLLDTMSGVVNNEKDQANQK